MDIKECVKHMFNDFFISFSCIVLMMTVYLRFMGLDSVHMRDIGGGLLISVLTSLSEIILYSKREQRRTEALVRGVIHFFVVIGIALGVSARFRWFAWGEPRHVLTFLGMALGVYFVVVAITFLQTKKISDELNDRLRERYRG